jgi:uncharacterized membrane protein
MLDVSTTSLGILLTPLAIAKTVHVIALIIWIGGMFFAHLCLRPVATQLLEPSIRAQFWVQVFTRFFFWVWIAVALLFISGLVIIHLYGGMGGARPHIHLMLGLGVVMAMIFTHIFFAPYRRLRHAVAQQNIEQAIQMLTQIRWLMTFNLSLGLITVVIVMIGRG